VIQSAVQGKVRGQVLFGSHEIGLDPWNGFVYLQWFMSDEHTTTNVSTAGFRSLEERLAGRPQVLARFHSMADMMDRAMAEGCTADHAEELASQQLRQLGRELLGDWAEEKQTASLAQARREHPSAIKHIKKK